MVSQNERRGAEKGGENSNAVWFRDGERWGDDRRRRWRRRSRMDRIRGSGMGTSEGWSRLDVLEGRQDVDSTHGCVTVQAQVAKTRRQKSSKRCSGDLFGQ